MARIQIKTNDSIFPHLLVDGEDISDIVTEYTVSQKAGEIPIVTLKLVGTDMAISEQCGFRFPKHVRDFLEKLHKSSAVQESPGTADK